MGALKPGYQVSKELVLGRRLGAGGMGTVWIAEHKKLQTDVVIKFLSESLTADPEACQRFSREVTATVQVRSPHVVQLFDHGVTESGTPYIVMELLEGMDLARTLRKRGRLPPDEVVHILEGVTAALQKVHEKGIVHRDVKPANVFLCSGSPRPFVKLVDFGIAKRLEDETMTATNALIGTPAYMSPEQMNSSSWIDHRCDLWALGVLAFHMLTGAPPFRGANIATIVHAIMSEPTPKITTVVPELPPQVDVWLTQALALDPNKRFSTAHDLLTAFELALGDLAYATTRRMEGSGAAPVVVVHTTPSQPSGVDIVGPLAPPMAAGGGVPPPARSSPSLTGPHRPSAPPPAPTGSGLVALEAMPSGSVVVRPSSSSAHQLSFDGVGATLGPSAVTHSPHGVGTSSSSASRLKWFALGGGALLMVLTLIGASLRIGYGMRGAADPNTAAQGSGNTTGASATNPAPTLSGAAGSVVASAAASAATTTTSPSAHTAGSRTTPTRRPRSGSSGRHADDDDPGF